MNYYADTYTNDEMNSICIRIIEGIYTVKDRPKARDIGCVFTSDDNTVNRFIKHRKQPYDVLRVGENTITVKEDNYNDEIKKRVPECTYTLL